MVNGFRFIHHPKFGKPERRNRSHVMLQEIVQQGQQRASTNLKLITFNILAPCYNNLNNSKVPESSNEEQFVCRNTQICDQILNSDADIVCIQEFWYQSEVLRNLYYSKLSHIYDIRELQRTSHWRSRDDGLAVFTNKQKLIVQDCKDILFHDCGDRVAQLLLLALRNETVMNMYNNNVTAALSQLQQFICVNTHLLFPHNEYSTNIRIREMSKVLDYIESYRQRELCQSVCGRSDVRIPVVIAGDFNGTPKGSVFRLMKSQNFKSSQEEFWSSQNANTTEISTLRDILSHPELDSDLEFQDQFMDPGDDQVSTPSEIQFSQSSSVALPIKQSAEELSIIASASKSSKWNSWISHKSHRQDIIPVDHVFFSNPSDQVESRLPALPDWTNLVFRELHQRVIFTVGSSSMRDAFTVFDHDNSSFISPDEFASALRKLGFLGDGTPALTNEEITALIDSADRDGSGYIDYKEFCDRFWIASENVEQPTGIKGMRTAFKRSSWLSSKNVPSLNSTRTSKDGDDKQDSNQAASSSVTTSEESQKVVLGVPLGDLSVTSVTLYPRELEEGIWPADYTLSDHGMVEVVFQSAELIGSGSVAS